MQRIHSNPVILPPKKDYKAYKTITSGTSSVQNSLHKKVDYLAISKQKRADILTVDSKDPFVEAHIKSIKEKITLLNNINN